MGVNTYESDGSDPWVALVEPPKGYTFGTRMVSQAEFCYRTKLNGFGFLVVNGGTFRFAVPVEQSVQ